MTTMPMPATRTATRHTARAPHVARYRRRRPWWLGALDRELLALGEYVEHQARVTVAATAIFALIYFGANGGLG